MAYTRLVKLIEIEQNKKLDIEADADEFIQNRSSSSFSMGSIMECRNTSNLNIANSPFPLISDYLRIFFFHRFDAIMVIVIMRY